MVWSDIQQGARIRGLLPIRIAARGTLIQYWADVTSLLEERAPKFGQDERGAVYVRIVVPRGAYRSLRHFNLLLSFSFPCGYDDSNLTRGVCWNGGDCIPRRVGERIASRVELRTSSREVQPERLSLDRYASSVLERRMGEGEIARREEGCGGLVWVRAVGNDHVKGVGRRLGEEGEAVRDVDGHARRREKSGHVRKVKFRDADDGLEGN